MLKAKRIVILSTNNLMIRKSYTFFAALFACYLMSGIPRALAQELESSTSDVAATSIEEELYFTKEELVVGPTKRAVKLEEAPANVTIITHEDIIQSGATNLAEVFRRVPGMDVVTITAADTEVSARGFATPITDGDRTTVLIDGRTFYLDFLGSTIWAQFPVPLDDIKQIEVIKGPLSSLYGNRALLGVINIVTFSPEETRTLLSGGGGRFWMAEGNFIHAGKFADGYWYKVSGTYNRSNEFSDADQGAPSRDRQDFSVMGQFDFNPQDTTNINLRAGFTQASDKLQFGGLTTWNDRRSLIDGRASHDFGKWGDLNFQTYWERHYLNNQTYNFAPGALDTVDSEIRHNIAFDITSDIHNTAIYGFNYRLLDGEGPLTQSIHNFAGFFQDEIRFYDWVILTGGVRVDYQKDYAGMNTSAHGSLVFLFHPRYTLRLGTATAFQNPTMIHYFTNVAIPWSPAPFVNVQLVGNRNMKAEHVLYFDMGNTIKPIDQLKIRADFFYYRLNDMFNPALNFVDPTNLQISFRNDGGAEAIGCEIGVDGEITKWLQGYAYWAYEHFNAINGNIDPTPNLGNPKHKVGAGLRGKWWEDRFTANVDFYYIRHHQMQEGVINFAITPVVGVGDVYLLNMRLGFWPIKDHLELAVSANNILNDNTNQIPAFDNTLSLPLSERPQFNIWGSLRYLF